VHRSIVELDSVRISLPPIGINFPCQQLSLPSILSSALPQDLFNNFVASTGIPKYFIGKQPEAREDQAILILLVDSLSKTI
jgi:hypothetical protein